MTKREISEIKVAVAVLSEEVRGEVEKAIIDAVNGKENKFLGFYLASEYDRIKSEDEEVTIEEFLDTNIASINVYSDNGEIKGYDDPSNLPARPIAEYIKEYKSLFEEYKDPEIKGYYNEIINLIGE